MPAARAASLAPAVTLTILVAASVAAAAALYASLSPSLSAIGARSRAAEEVVLSARSGFANGWFVVALRNLGRGGLCVENVTLLNADGFPVAEAVILGASTPLELKAGDIILLASKERPAYVEVRLCDGVLGVVEVPG